MPRACFALNQATKLTELRKSHCQTSLDVAWTRQGMKGHEKSRQDLQQGSAELPRRDHSQGGTETNCSSRAAPGHREPSHHTHLTKLIHGFKIIIFLNTVGVSLQLIAFK